VKLTIKNLSAFKNLGGTIGFVIIPEVYKGKCAFHTGGDDFTIEDNSLLDDVLKNHLIEELENNNDLLHAAKYYDLVEEDETDVIGFINYSLEYN